MVATPKISLCIATMNRWDFLQKYIPEYLQNPYINEIVITDENGADIEKIRASAFGQNPKLRLYKNERRLGAYLNKERAVSLATNEWISLMDSDNFAPLWYFQAWANEIQQNGLHSNYLYAPSKTLPTPTQSDIFDWEHLIGLQINANNYQLYRNLKLFDVLENTGNYIFNKSFYMSVAGDCKDLIENEGVWDVQVKNAYLLKHGAVIVPVAGMQYVHVVHKDSIYLQTLHEHERIKPILNKLLDSIGK